MHFTASRDYSLQSSSVHYVLLVTGLQLLLLSVSLKLCHGVYSDDVEVYPSDPKEGDSVHLECFIWSKDGNKLTNNGQFLDEEFGNRTDTNLEFYSYRVTLIISSVSRNDTGIYTCSLHGGIYDTSYDERSVTVNVLYYPRRGFPICSVHSDIDSIDSTLSCVSEIGNPEVSLDWTSNDDQTLHEDFKHVVKLSTELVTSELTVNNSQINSNDEYTCSVKSSKFTYVHNCTIRGEAIRFVNVIPRKLNIGVSGKAEFNCVTNVDPIRWLWGTEPQESKSRISTLGSTFRIDPVLSEDNGTSISCYALFEDYWLQANAELWVSLNSSQLGIQNNTIGHNEANLPKNTNVKGGNGNNSFAWISAFVVMTILALVVAIGFIVYVYRNKQNGKMSTSKSAQAIFSAQPKANQNIKGKTEDNYMELDHNRQKSKECSGLALGANRDTTQSSIRYVNNAFEKGSTEIGGDDELYDYPETKESEQYEDVKV